MLKDLDPVFYLYVLLTFFMLIITFIILRKSLSAVNYLFSFTPLTFSLVIFLNILQYFFSIPPLIPRVPYLLAPLGIFSAGVYIFNGKSFFRDDKVLSFIVVYSFYAIVLSLYIEFSDSLFFNGLMHLSVIFPLIPSLYYYFRLLKIIPESSNSIFTLLLGIIIAIVGAVMRSYYFFTISDTSDFVPGLVLIFIGVLIIIISFTAFSEGNSNPS